jgi:hypothetical protein
VRKSVRNFIFIAVTHPITVALHKKNVHGDEVKCDLCIYSTGLKSSLAWHKEKVLLDDDSIKKSCKLSGQLSGHRPRRHRFSLKTPHENAALKFEGEGVQQLWSIVLCIVCSSFYSENHVNGCKMDIKPVSGHHKIVNESYKCVRDFWYTQEYDKL